MNTTEQTPAPWRSRWYSAAKRFGIAAFASIVLTVSGLYIGIGSVVFFVLPIVAAVWGFFSPAPYDERPSVAAKVGVVALGAFGLHWLWFVVVSFLAMHAAFFGTSGRLDADVFDPADAPAWSVLLECVPAGATDLRWEGNSAGLGGYEKLQCRAREEDFLALAKEKGVELRRDDRSFNANTNTASMVNVFNFPIPPDAPVPEHFWFHAWLQSNFGGRYFVFDIDRGILYGKYSSN